MPRRLDGRIGRDKRGKNWYETNETSAERSQDKVSKALEKNDEAKKLEIRCDRPWGSFFILEDSNHSKVKRLVVNPGHRLSLQSHKYREEHWVVIKGVAQVTLDTEERSLQYGDYVFVKRGTKHRIACTGSEPVEIIEVQTGDSFPEEDITRFADDYDRI